MPVKEISGVKFVIRLPDQDTLSEAAKKFLVQEMRPNLNDGKIWIKSVWSDINSELHQLQQLGFNGEDHNDPDVYLYSSDNPYPEIPWALRTPVKYIDDKEPKMQILWVNKESTNLTFEDRPFRIATEEEYASPMAWLNEKEKPKTVFPFAKVTKKVDINAPIRGKEPAGTFNLIVNNLVQNFRSSGMDKDTKSEFSAHGELVQVDESDNRLERSGMLHRMRDELFRSQTASVAIRRHEDNVRAELDESYCVFGGASGIGDEPIPIAVFNLKSNIYDYVEKAFVMANPQIELKLKFTKAIQREEMSLTFDEHPNSETGLTTNHFTLDSNNKSYGIWYAHCKLIEIKNG